MRIVLLLALALPALYICLRFLAPLQLPRRWLLFWSLFALLCAEKLAVTTLLTGSPNAFLPRSLILVGGFGNALVLMLAFLVLGRDLIWLSLKAFRRLVLFAAPLLPNSAAAALAALPPNGKTSSIHPAGRLSIFAPASRTGALLALTMACLLTGYGMLEALRVPAPRHLTLERHDLPKGLHGLTMIQLSDLHIGPAFKRDWLKGLVEKVNSEHPDLILITGDLVDGSPQQLAFDIAPLAELKARYGVWLVPGNHEFYSGAARWLSLFESMGIHILYNSHALLSLQGSLLALIGVSDPAERERFGGQGPDLRQALQGIPAEAYPLLLAHNPSFALDNAEAHIAIQLSGHTHGGILWPLVPVVAAFNNGFVRGLYAVQDMSLYVTSGAGLWAGLPFRFLVSPEYPVFHLTRVDN